MLSSRSSPSFASVEKLAQDDYLNLMKACNCPGEQHLDGGQVTEELIKVRAERDVLGITVQHLKQEME